MEKIDNENKDKKLIQKLKFKLEKKLFERIKELNIKIIKIKQSNKEQLKGDE